MGACRVFFVVVFCLVTSLALAQQTGGTEPHNGSIVGIVADAQDALIPGASVQIVGESVSDHATKTNAVGAFAINALPTGQTLQVTIKAEGFGDWKSNSIVLTPGQMLDLQTVKLIVAASLTSVAAVAPEKVAVEQVQLAERQRLFGILPNFYVTYDTRFVPLSPKLKFRLALRTATDPATFLGAGFLAGIDQASDVAPHYEQGASGYGKRFAAAYAGSAIDIVLGGAILPVLFHQDPRYFYQGTGTKKSRMLHAISSPFVAKGDNGHWQVNISSIGGDLGASAMTNLYYPESDRGGGLVIKGFLEASGARIASSLLQEFVFRRLTTNSAHRTRSSKAHAVSP
jgi:carboxypeptidase family protein